MATSITPQSLGSIMNAGSIRLDSLATGNRLLNVGFANTFKVSIQTEEVASKAQGSDAVSFAKPTQLTGEIGVDLINLDLMAFITGSKVGEALRRITKDKKVLITEADQQVTITGTPVGGIVSAYLLRKDGSTILSKLANPTFATGKVTLTGAKVGDIVLIVYIEETQARGITIKGVPEESEFYKLDALVKSKSWEDGKFTFLNLVLNKIAVQNSIDIEFTAENPSSFTIKFKALVDGLGDIGQMVEIPTTVVFE